MRDEIEENRLLPDKVLSNPLRNNVQMEIENKKPKFYNNFYLKWAKAEN